MGSEPFSASAGRPRVSILVAVSTNGVIGRDGELPWRLSDDLVRFKARTMGHSILLGRKTYESIGRQLPGRKSIALSRDLTWRPGDEGVAVATSLENALAIAAAAKDYATDEAFVIGGGEIYRLALPYADRVNLTRVHVTIEGDATFPELDPDEWRLVSSEDHAADERNEHNCTYEVWERTAEDLVF